MPKTLVWLASYPKSGNTWLRAFLANYFFDTPEPLTLNQIRHVSFGDSGLTPYAELLGRNPIGLAEGQMAQLRHAVLSRISARGQMNFVKTHSWNRPLGPAPLIPAELTAAAVLITRDPRDMVLSYADHWAVSLEEATRQISDPANRIPANPKTVAQYLGDWSSHLESWQGARGFPVLTLRYEDMLADPEAAFTRVLAHLGAPLDQSALHQAIDRASFKALSTAEAAQGFSERGASQKAFFRQGKAGTWREALPPPLAEAIWARHGAAMARLGYSQA